MNQKHTYKKILSLILAAVIILSSMLSVYACTEEIKTKNEETRRILAEEIVEVARSQIGFYESSINKFSTWYYGYENETSWCTIFVSWCADQIGAMSTAVPKRSACLSMKLWFERRGEFYPVDSYYLPQKGDIVFINTEVDGTDNIHHTEIITEDGFTIANDTICVNCVGGNTSDINYNGTEYVTEKIRPVLGDKAEIVGYAHPSYEKSDSLIGDYYSFKDDHSSDFSKLIYSKLLSFLLKFEELFNEMNKALRAPIIKTEDSEPQSIVLF